jgi:hypothetical protein
MPWRREATTGHGSGQQTPMQEILFEYEMNPTTWVYVSSLMIVGIYFKFHRFLSVRNLDLIALIAFSPALLIIARVDEHWGYLWLFSVSGFFLFRLLLDPLMVRRPLLEPNMSASGLTFTGVALLVFLMANVIIGKVPDQNLRGMHLLRRSHQVEPAAAPNPVEHRPGFRPFQVLAELDEQTTTNDGAELTPSQLSFHRVVSRTAAILGHLAVVIGIVLVGYRHFDNTHTGVAAATLYLLLPYTAQLTGEIDHVVPGAILVWAVESYRRPVWSGLLFGLAAGLIFYPLFLLPLWCSFYWRRGLVRFLASAIITLAILVVVLAALSGSFAEFGAQVRQMFGWTSLWGEHASGFWEYHRQAYRIPIMAAFLVLCGSLALWPAQKNFGTLLSLSSAVMLAAQFWSTHQGGLYMAWYLPLLMLTIFRPNLEDRVALTAVVEGRVPGPIRKLVRSTVRTGRRAAV